jgi:transcriptional regulator with XRE-family HTH domain
MPKKHEKKHTGAGRNGAMGKKTRYTSVSEMLAEHAPDEKFREEFDEHAGRRRIIKRMMALRALKGMSQQDVAKEMGYSQSRISKLENGFDDDIRIGDLRSYVSSLGFRLGFVFVDRDFTAVEEIKQHAFRIKELLDRLAHLAGGDEKMAQAVSGFFGEAFFNVVRMIQESASKLPRRPADDRPYLQIHVAMKKPDPTCDEDCVDPEADPQQLVAK